MKQMKQILPQKNPKFFCEKCQFGTGNKKDFNRHIATAKHLDETNETKKNPKKPQINTMLKCVECLLFFNSRTSLWRHKKMCHNNIDCEDETKIQLLNNIFQTHMKDNKELRDLLIDQNNKLLEICKDKTDKVEKTYIGSNNNINSNNKTFNLQLFLNEQCKDAMNIMDFVDSLKLQLSDLENVGKLGYVNGISNIIVKNLNALDVHKRPVHCSDPKREVLYIKDENKWEKENDKKNKIKKAIKYLANKNTKLIPEWKAKNPECIFSDSKKSDEYNKIIIEAMGGEEINNNVDNNENKIIKNVAKCVVIDKLVF
jgi:hypothetical protein